MPVPFVDLSREYDEIADEIDESLNEVFKSAYYIGGENVAAFEEEFADYVGTRHGIGVNSGSDALTLAIRALGVDEGDEVIVPSHTFISTANAAVKNGARPVFVDVDPRTLVMDPDAVTEAITDRTAAIIPVHLYGHPVEMDPILDLAETHDLAVVEDASQAHGATYRGERVGQFGDVGCFSLYPTKNLGAYGDAGVMVTDNEALADRLHSLRDYGRVSKYRFDRIENHSRLDELQAAILREKLGHLDEWNKRRQHAAARYHDFLTDTHAEPQSVADSVDHVYHLFVIRHPERDAVRRHLDDAGISTLVHYPIPVHKQPAYDHLEPRHNLSVTEDIVEEIVSLPIHPWIRDEELETVARTLSEFDK